MPREGGHMTRERDRGWGSRGRPGGGAGGGPAGTCGGTALLFAGGALHFALVFEFDALIGYALTSLVVVHLVARGGRCVRAWMYAMGGLHLLLVGALSYAVHASGIGSGAVTGMGRADVYATGGYAEQVALRLDRFVLYRLASLFVIPMSVVLFLCGSRLLRAGAFARGARGTRLRKRMMLAGLGAGVPLNLLTAFGGPGRFAVDRPEFPGARLLPCVAGEGGALGAGGRPPHARIEVARLWRAQTDRSALCSFSSPC